SLAGGRGAAGRTCLRASDGLAQEDAGATPNHIVRGHAFRQTYQLSCEQCHCIQTLYPVTLSEGGRSRSEWPSESTRPYFPPMPNERRTYCAYIMGSLSGTLYIVMTGNLHKRVFEHKFCRIEGCWPTYQVER